MPHLEQPMELGGGPSLAVRIARTAALSAVAITVFALAFAIVVVASTP